MDSHNIVASSFLSNNWSSTLPWIRCFLIRDKIIVDCFAHSRGLKHLIFKFVLLTSGISIHHKLFTHLNVFSTEIYSYETIVFPNILVKLQNSQVDLKWINIFLFIFRIIMNILNSIAILCDMLSIDVWMKFNIIIFFPGTRS
jgi:hypothetical protein